MRKMDEMEMAINLKAIKYAWFYTVIFLFVWTAWDFYHTREMGLPFILLISQNLILMLIRLVLSRRMSR